MFKKVLFFIYLPILTITLSACQSGVRQGVTTSDQLKGEIRYVATPLVIDHSCISNQRKIDPACLKKAQTKIAKPGISAEQALAYFSGKTTLSYSPIHMTQVAYYHENGNIYLWYPGNRAVVDGMWRIIKSEDNRRVNVCYKYFDKRSMILTALNSKWTCTDASTHIGNIIQETEQGDTFSLARGNLPFVMPRQKYTLDQLKSRN